MAYPYNFKLSDFSFNKKYNTSGIIPEGQDYNWARFNNNLNQQPSLNFNADDFANNYLKEQFPIDNPAVGESAVGENASPTLYGNGKLSKVNWGSLVEPIGGLVQSIKNDTYRNKEKYTELRNYAKQGNVDSFGALDDVYANLGYMPTATRYDFGKSDNPVGDIVKDSISGASFGTSIAPGWGTLIGGVVGLANGLLRTGINSAKSKNAYNRYLLAQNRASDELLNNINNSYNNASMNEYNNLMYNIAACGGKLNKYDIGGDLNNGVNIIGNGETHEMNPYEGVQQGVDSQGVPNMVEEGEVVWEDENYVFSNRLKVPANKSKKKDDETKEETFARKYAGKTFAEAAERIQRESSERPINSISKDTKNDNLSMLRDLQEELKMKQQADEFKQEINNMSPEDLMGLQQMLGAMGQQGMEQPMPEQIPQEDMMPQGMTDMVGNPAMMGMPMACGGKLHKYGYGGNMFALGGMSPDKWTLDTLQNTDLSDLSALPKKQTYGEALAFRGEFLKNAMDNMKGKYYAAIEQTHPSIYNKMIKGEPLSKDELETAKKVIHNCITSTSTANSFAEEELRNAIDKYKDALRLNFKAQGIDDKEIEESLAGLTTGLTTDSNDEVYTGIVARELQPSFSKDNYVIETDYDFPKGKVPEGSPLYKLLKELPDGVDLGVGYNGNSADPSSPAHYIKLYHDENGEPMLFEGNQSDYIKAQYAAAEEAMLNGKDFKWMNPMEYNEWIKTHNKGIDSKGNPIKYNSYEGSHVSEPGSIMNRPSYRKHDIGNKGENVIDMGHGRLRIMFPKMENISDSDFNDYIQTLQQNNIEVPLNKVQYEIPIDESTGKEGNARIRSIYPVSQDASVGKMSYPELESIYQETYTPNNLKPTINPISKPYIENDRPILNDMVDRWWLHDNSKVHYQNLPYYPSKEDENIKPIPLADGGSMYIKPENRGKFTALKERTGKSSTWYKKHGTPEEKKMATFALNALKWKHPDGGELNKFYFDDEPYKEINASEVDIYPNLLPEVAVTPDSYKKKTHPWLREQWDNFSAKNPLDSLLKAPYIGSMLGVMSNLFRNKSNDYANERMVMDRLTPPNLSVRPYGTRYSYTPQSKLAVLNDLNAMYQAGRNANINLSNANRAAKAAYNVAADLGYIDNLGKYSRMLNEEDFNNRYKTTEANNALESSLASADYQAAAANAQARNMQLHTLMQLVNSMNAKDMYNDQIEGANWTTMFDNAGNLGKFLFTMKQIEQNPALFYKYLQDYGIGYTGGNRTAAFGGEIDLTPIGKRFNKKDRKDLRRI